MASTMTDRTGDTHLRSFAITALVLLLLGAAVVGIADRFLNETRSIDVAQQQLTGLAQIGRAEREAIAAQRAYLLTGDVEQRNRFQQGIARVSFSVVEFDRVAAQGSDYTSEVAALQHALDARIKRAELVVATHDRDGADAAQTLLRDGTSIGLELAIRDASERLSNAINTQLAAAMAASERSSYWLLLAAALGAPVALLALGIGYLTLRREVRSRRAAEQDNESARIKLQTSVERLTQVSGDMQRLSAYAGLLQTCDTTEEVLDVTRVCFAALIPDYAGMVYLIGNNQTEAAMAAEWGLTRLVSADRIAPAQCWAWRRAQPYLTTSDNADLRCTHVTGSAQATASLCLPLNAHGVTHGLLYIDGPEPLRNERLATTAAEQLSLALANLSLRESLREQSIKDALTGLYNRRHLLRTLGVEGARSERGGRPLALMMLDVDHFKAFNDCHGHAAGDAVLVAVGRMLAATHRAGDIACRYGGEEFVVILPETDVEAARACAEATRRAIAELKLDFDGNELPPITASFGVAAFPGSTENPDQLLDAADKALYLAKSRGRNQVALSERASPLSPNSPQTIDL
jgi:diguanylate cyclase (GGDEF)-like protein